MNIRLPIAYLLFLDKLIYIPPLPNLVKDQVSTPFPHLLLSDMSTLYLFQYVRRWSNFYMTLFEQYLLSTSVEIKVPS